MIADHPGPISLWPDPDRLGTVADLYELTMMAGYIAAGIDRQRAVFELFVRKLPANRSYLVLAGLEQAIGDVLRFRISDEQAAGLAALPVFRRVGPGVLDAIRTLRFSGDIWAIPEGSAVFGGEPLVRVEAPLAEAQWIETLLIASLSYPTLVASKAARVVHAAEGRDLFDFGARRAPGPHAGFLAARAAYLAGFSGTSHVEAARLLGIPCVGTMAHSWVMSFPTESAAFETFAATFGPEATTLLVDTFDTEAGLRHAAEIRPPVRAIRIDSGDLAATARQARAILDPSTRILVSGDLDESGVRSLVKSGAPIDGFGIGTELVTSRDAPALAMVYKLVELEGEGRIKRSPDKSTYPFAKQVFRDSGPDGRFLGDRVVRDGESAPGEPLLVPVVRSGRLAARLPGVGAIRERCRAQVGRLPIGLRGLGSGVPYPVEFGETLEAEKARLVGLVG